jgi:hypothetical protein
LGLHISTSIALLNNIFDPSTMLTFIVEPAYMLMNVFAPVADKPPVGVAQRQVQCMLSDICWFG